MKRLFTTCTMLLVLSCQPLAQSDELADPTRPVTLRAPTPTSVTTASASVLKLDAIVHSDERRLAIVNGKLLRVGEWLGNVRIDAISNDAVRYSRAGRSQTLRLANQAIQVRRQAASHEAEK